MPGAKPNTTSLQEGNENPVSDWQPSSSKRENKEELQTKQTRLIQDWKGKGRFLRRIMVVGKCVVISWHKL